MSVGLSLIEQDCLFRNTSFDLAEFIDRLHQQSNWKLEDSDQWKILERLERRECIKEVLKGLGTFE